MGFSLVDFGVLALYIVGTTVWGTWLGRGQKNAQDYFLGDRNLPWWAVLFSVVSTETSTLTVLSIPGLAYATNLGFLQITFGYLVGRIVVAYVLLPRYYRGELTTAYQLLEQRFGLATRRFASSIFMVTRALADGVRLFATAIPLALLTGWSYPVAILAMGLYTVVYTFVGGIRSVVWVDVVQTVVYLGGAVAALVLLVAKLPGGWDQVFSAAADAGKLQLFNVSGDWSQPYTVWAGLIGGAFLSMASHGADQLIVQRLLTCRSLKESRLALIGSGLFAMTQFALFLVIGLALWSFYGGRPFERTDEIFAGFVLQELPSGMRGLLIAAIIAAASLSSSLNSLSSATTYDLYAPMRRGLTDRELLRIGRVFTLLWGFILMGGAMLFRSRDTPVVEIGLAIASFTYGGLLGAFFLGILNRRAVQRDAIAAIAIGIVAMVAIVFGRRYAPALEAVGWPGVAGTFSTLSAIAWPWHVVIGTVITCGAGTILSWLHPDTSRPSPARTPRER